MSKTSGKQMQKRTQYNGNTPQILPIPCNKFVMKNLKYTNLNETEYSEGQYLAFVSYEYKKGVIKQFICRTKSDKWISLNTYGLPYRDGKYYDASKANYMKMPLDEDDEGAKFLMDMLKEIDDYNEKNKNQILLLETPTKGKKTKINNISKKYSYQPIVRKPVIKDDDDVDDDESSEDNNNNKYNNNFTRPDYCKLFFDVDYKSGNLKTEIRLFEDENDKDPKTLELHSVTQLYDYMPLKSKIRFGSITINKLWAAKSAMAGADTRKYGLGLKIKKIDIITGEGSTGQASDQLRGFDVFQMNGSESTIDSSSDGNLSLSADNKKEKKEKKVSLAADSDSIGDSQDNDNTHSTSNEDITSSSNDS
jgi:hypothetical protein